MTRNPFPPKGDEYLFNFDLAQPGEDSSSDLSVGSGPSSDAQAFICGEETEVEPEPEEEVSTPAPVQEEEEVVEETPAPSSPVRMFAGVCRSTLRPLPRLTVPHFQRCLPRLPRPPGARPVPGNPRRVFVFFSKGITGLLVDFGGW